MLLLPHFCSVFYSKTGATREWGRQREDKRWRERGSERVGEVGWIKR